MTLLEDILYVIVTIGVIGLLLFVLGLIIYVVEGWRL